MAQMCTNYRLDFCVAVYKSLCAQRSYEINSLWSPICAELAVLMAYLGARGETRQQMADLLGLNKDYSVEHFCALLTEMKKNEDKNHSSTKSPVENYKLFLATAGFIEEELPLNAEYTDTLRTLFNTVCQPVHFRTEPSEAVQRINQFVENHTSGTIRDTLTSSDINADTAFILISSVYFEAEWDCRFFEEHTVKKPFNLADGSQVMVDTMHAMTRCRYYESKELGGARFLQLWYGEELSSACFILPGKNARSATWTPGSAMSDLQRALTPALLNKALDSLQPISYGTIQLPKFRIEHSIDMESTLQKLGMRSAFSRSADFSGISSRSLRIDKIKQKVYIDVNERGTVASATTLVRLKNCSLPPQTRVEFAADRPFMFLLRHEKTGTVLFIGHVMDPSAES